jgi:hypothetical protein
MFTSPQARPGLAVDVGSLGSTSGASTTHRSHSFCHLAWGCRLSRVAAGLRDGSRASFAPIQENAAHRPPCNRAWSEAHRRPGEGRGPAYYPPDDAKSGRVSPIRFVPAQFVQSERAIRAICWRDSCVVTLLTEEQSRRGQPTRQRRR